MIIRSFLLRQKRTKKGDRKTMYSSFSGGASIKLLYYCGEKQLSPDRFINSNNDFFIVVLYTIIMSVALSPFNSSTTDERIATQRCSTGVTEAGIKKI